MITKVQFTYGHKFYTKFSFQQRLKNSKNEDRFIILSLETKEKLKLLTAKKGVNEA